MKPAKTIPLPEPFIFLFRGTNRLCVGSAPKDALGSFPSLQSALLERIKARNRIPLAPAGCIARR